MQKKQDIEMQIAGYVIHYFNRDISNKELKKLDQWLQESPENKETFFQLKNIHDVIRYRKMQSKEERKENWLKLEQKIALSKVAPLPAATGKQHFKRSLKYFAIVAAASILGFVIRWNHTSQQDTSLSPVAQVETRYHEIHVPKGGKPGFITLADGTKIRLNVAGTLRYPANSAASVREVFLDGEAWFDVTEDKENPFIVHLPHQTITVHGTRFNVEAYPDESIHKVTLLSGSISLETNNSKGELINQIELLPGQQASFDIMAGQVAVEDADTSVAWMRREYKFKDETLENIAKRLEKHYDVTIYLTDEVKDIRYTGTLYFDRPIEQTLRVINYKERFNYMQSENTVHILKK